MTANLGSDSRLLGLVTRYGEAGDTKRKVAPKYRDANIVVLWMLWMVSLACAWHVLLSPLVLAAHSRLWIRVRSYGFLFSVRALVF